jgi:3-hydroxyisobutyrate dehydrogenase-like beta-hydroxyacid dehydrogenase
MSEVSVLGTGLMGSALARAFMAAGHTLTVWNRTSSAADPLVRNGARWAASAAEAFAASPLSVVCVHNYEAAQSFMRSPAAEKALSGKTLLQLTTGTTREAREGEAWARPIGCGYLDGKIKSYPAGIGRDYTVIIVSGSQALFDTHRQVLSALVGQVTYLGEPIAYSATLDAAGLTRFCGLVVGFLYGLLLCQKEGFPTEQYVAKAIEGMSPGTAEALNRMGRTIRESTFDDAEATVDIYAASLESIARTFRDSGLNTEFPALMQRLFEKASSAGMGKKDGSALIKALQAPNSAT